MGTREIAHKIIDEMPEKQLLGFVMLFNNYKPKKKNTVESVMGCLSQYAKPFDGDMQECIEDESKAWQEAAVERYKRSMLDDEEDICEDS